MIVRFKFFSALLVGLVVAGAALAQSGFDRRGGDYQRFDIRSGDPQVCAEACERDSRCKAWTFSYPRTANALATCWLKNKVPPRNDDKCCVSGVRGAGVIAPRQGPVEFGIDRLGGDFRDFETPPEPAGAACNAACEADNKCRAWTYVRPGYIGASARCFLKDRITRPRAKPCCISGVVR
ncbi:MAG: PAN domain-containing protein [Pseudolabrys sp.]|nr:PAN domain-containing protein [Pseudolabrys sp.]MDP2296776.1 PAN domain-containing protein [Pseudolabrys sp.]